MKVLDYGLQVCIPLMTILLCGEEYWSLIVCRMMLEEHMLKISPAKDVDCCTYLTHIDNTVQQI